MPVFIATGLRPGGTAAVSTFPFLPNCEEEMLTAGEVAGEGRAGEWAGGRRALLSLAW